MQEVNPLEVVKPMRSFQFIDLTAEQQKEAASVYLNAAPGDGFYYYIGTTGKVLHRMALKIGVVNEFRIDISGIMQTQPKPVGRGRAVEIAVTGEFMEEDEGASRLVAETTALLAKITANEYALGYRNRTGQQLTPHEIELRAYQELEEICRQKSLSFHDCREALKDLLAK